EPLLQTSPGRFVRDARHRQPGRIRARRRRSAHQQRRHRLHRRHAIGRRTRSHDLRRPHRAARVQHVGRGDHHGQRPAQCQSGSSDDGLRAGGRRALDGRCADGERRARHPRHALGHPGL
ncbi:MAG: hypothetical protein AVDCRST_MAG51-2219, partial [uncultured Ramlibacter sp.]